MLHTRLFSPHPPPRIPCVSRAPSVWPPAPAWLAAGRGERFIRGMPAVSILMVFHRDTPFLRPAIASALNQTWRDLELVLVDNGTGITAPDLGAIGADPRLRWVRLGSNEGIPGGHNAGVAAASGEFVALLDYDDLAKPTRIERQLTELRRRSDAALVSGLAERVDERGRAIGDHVFCLPRSEEHAVYSAYGGPIVLASALVRRDVLTAFPYRREFPFAADLDFQARVAERWPMVVMPEVQLSYRWYEQQTTQQRSREVERSRAIIQLTSARRRAGRAEELATICGETQSHTAVQAWRHVAQRSLREGFWLHAAFQARRSFACEPSLDGFAKAFRLARKAMTGAPRGERALVARMFLRGPVRALRLHPA